MTGRRSLIDGLNATPAVDPQLEKDFVFQAKADNATVTAAAPASKPPAAAPQVTARAPISTRIRNDIAVALKKASLQRQLDKVEPNTISDILETALEPWLKSNGYL